MTLATLLNTPVTIISRHESGATDRFGNDVPTEATVETVGELQQRQRNEPAGEGETSSADFVLFLPADVHVTTGDAAIVDGQTYEVIGDPWRARNPRTRQFHHIEATVRRVAGAGDEGAS